MVYLKDQLVKLLVEKGLLSAEQAEKIIFTQKKENAQLSSLLQEIIKKETLLEFIKGNFNIPNVDTSQLKIFPEVVNLIPGNTAKKYRIFPLMKGESGLTLGLVNLLTLFDLDEIRELKEQKINPVVLNNTQLSDLLKTHYAIKTDSSDKKTMEDILGEALGDVSIKSQDEIAVSDLEHATQEMPIVKATNFILDKAIEVKASDILIEPLDKSTRIRLRIDGIYHQIETLPRAFHPFIVSRIKVISDLDIAEHRLPQDGQFKVKFSDKEVDFRVSVFPTIMGEKVAIRILDKSLSLLDIDNLGLKEKSLQELKKAAMMPHGMILVCGPTGSGKTSTLYSVLKYVHSPEKNIVTVEDPVEYKLRGINQVAVNIKTGLLFSRCLRSILRQDPDIIMIGEIRDFETVDIAIKAALTGHLVLSTLHTTTAAGSIVRLIDMGVEPFLINASLIAIISQRLARRICVHCKEKITNEPYFRGRGCDECMQSGYRGRVLITEILYMSPKIRESIVSMGSLDERKIKEIARKEGMKTLREEGDDLARAGITSLEEVLRVTPAD